MKSLYFLWYYLNWLELITFVLIPTAIVLIIFVYLYFNIELIKLTLGSNNFLSEDLGILYKNKKQKEKL